MYHSVASLLDQFTELAHDSRRSHAELLCEFAEPVYERFEGLHCEYLDAYEGYRASVAEWTSFRDNIVRFCETLCTDHSLFNPLKSTTDIYWAGEDVIFREAYGRPDSLARKIRKFANTYAAPNVTGDKPIIPSVSLPYWEKVHLAETGFHNPRVEVRPVLRNFVAAIARYLRDRISEVHGTSGGCSDNAIITPSVMVRFKALKAAHCANEEEHIAAVRTFIDSALRGIAWSKAFVDREYAWQRTKLLR